MVSSRRVKAVTSFEWTTKSCKVLLQLCLKEFVWAPRRGGRASRIVRSMRSIGFQVTPLYCKTKLTSLLGAFTEVRFIKIMNSLCRVYGNEMFKA